VLSQSDSLNLLANSSTQNILEKLGYEYSNRGLSEYQKSRPNIVPTLVQAIVTELGLHPQFPPMSQREIQDGGLSQNVGLSIVREGSEFVLLEVDKSNVWVKFRYTTAEQAARAYIYKVVDAYWLRSDTIGKPNHTAAQCSWL
jgi:hypothetical protein